jgi:hypothetical protein
MKQGDKYFKHKMDNTIEEIEILSDPECEYLLKCKLKNGTIKIIHKETIQKHYSKGVQLKMFEENKKRKYERIFKKQENG